MRAAFVEPDVEHFVDVFREAALHAVEAEPETAEHPEVLAFGEPVRAVGRLAHLRDLLAELRRPVLDPEVARHPGHVDVAVGGNDPVIHQATPFVDSCSRGESARYTFPALMVSSGRRRSPAVMRSPRLSSSVQRPTSRESTERSAGAPGPSVPMSPARPSNTAAFAVPIATMSGNDTPSASSSF